MGVHVERVASEKTDECLATILRELHRQTRWRGHGADHAHSTGQSLLHNLKRRPPTDHQQMVLERESIVEHRAAKRLVDGVMTTDILPQRKQVAFRVAQAGGVQAPGFLECLLPGSQLVRQL